MSVTTSSSLLGIAAVVLASILWGTTGTAATFAPDVSPLAIGSLAMGLGGLLQTVIAWRPLKLHRHQVLKHARLVIIGGLCVALYPLAFYSSMYLSGVAIGTVISIGLAPIAAALIERIIDKRVLSRRWLLSISLGIAGVALLTLAKSPSVTVQSHGLNNLLGIGLGGIAAFTYAMYSWVSHRLIQRQIPSKAAIGAVFGTGGVLLLPVLLLTGEAFLHSSINISVGIYMAIIPMFLGYLLFGFGLNSINASMATTITLLEPVIAALLAVIIVGEQLSLVGWVGITLIGTCILIVSLPVKLFTPITKIALKYQRDPS
jgi:DME family drug/metabolite transporter